MDQNTQPTTESTQNYFTQPSTPATNQTVHAPGSSLPPTPERPPKKSRRTLWIILSSIVILIITALIITWITLANQASATAKQYKTEVVSYLDSLLNAESSEKRVEIFEKPVALKDAPFGTLLSPEYKKATELKKEYHAYVEKSLPIIRERASTQDLSSYFKELSVFFDKKVSTDMPEITDEASGKRAIATITGLKDRGEGFLKFAQRFENYTFDPKYKQYQESLTKALKFSSQKWLELAAIQGAVAKKQTDILEAREKGDTQAEQKATSELGGVVQNGIAQMQTIITQYQQNSPAITQAMLGFAKQVAADNYIQAVAQKAGDVGKATEELREKFAS